MALGPVIGGVLVTSVGLAFHLLDQPAGRTRRHRPDPAVHPRVQAPKARRVDGVGQVLVIVLLASLTYGIIEARTAAGPRLSSWLRSPSRWRRLLGLIAGKRRCNEPLIDLRFFRSVPFSGAAGIAVAAFATLGGFLFLNTLYLQDVRGFSPLKAGLATLPMAVMTMVLPPISGRHRRAHEDPAFLCSSPVSPSRSAARC